MPGFESRLPHDLERLIFETTAEEVQTKNEILRIMLVAWRVHGWLKPILYRSLQFGLDSLDNVRDPGLGHDPTQVERFRESTSHWLSPTLPCTWTRDMVLFLFPPLQLGPKLLSSFPDIRNIVLNTWSSTLSDEELTLLVSRPLRTVHFVSLNDFERFTAKLKEFPTSSGSALASHIIVERIAKLSLPNLLLFPCVSHIAMPSTPFFGDQMYSHILRALLDQAKIEVLLILLSDNIDHIDALESLRTNDLHDPRIVCGSMLIFRARCRWDSIWEDLEMLWTDCAMVVEGQRKQEPPGFGGLLSIA